MLFFAIDLPLLPLRYRRASRTMRLVDKVAQNGVIKFSEDNTLSERHVAVRFFIIPPPIPTTRDNMSNYAHQARSPAGVGSVMVKRKGKGFIWVAHCTPPKAGRFSDKAMF